ncbi:NAD-dependent epimerase/dehydratase family protein [Parasphingopyxis sp.]|uniref:NAD-dependent epimerase/dehydratase family protein n=1 Tax=Parasphingopyxis sp. TaxID=1920299 RepID=UPI002633271E|nr:NAD-dependent epimerase/dehydratase family protein [Parasphingopyxis sp.]
MAKTALVTGGTGYIGGEVIDQLLARGWAVHTTVRSTAKSEQRLRDRWPDAGERLKIFEADLESDAGWAEANAGCDAVAHVASPFPLAVPDNEDELIVPAREGTLRALRFAKEAGVTRFAQTSSVAAIAYGHDESRTEFDESDWTKIETPGVAPYTKSKTIAERAARDWVEANAPDMEFCSVNPTGVFGPVVNDDLSTSIELIKRLIDGSMPMIPEMGIGVVDVRDVAKIHVLALEAPAEKVRGERFAAANGFMWTREMAEVLRARIGDKARKVPKRKMPYVMVAILALFMPAMQQIKANIGKKRVTSGRHAAETLGFEYIPAEQTIVDTAESLVARGVVTL